MKTLTLGILAHVDAGKTSLTERLLHAAGVIDTPGRVDDGTTRTDTLDLERQRGITIKAAVVSFAVGDVTVNLVDTPGHPDFIAEVERVLDVLDGAVLVVSAVEGVQAQTRVLMRVLHRLRIPTLLFVNKCDRAGARPGEVVTEIAARLAPTAVGMGSVLAAGTRAARWVPYDEADPAFTERLTDVLVEVDDDLLAAMVQEAPGLPGRLRAAFADQSRGANVHPVFGGSAATGAGVAELMTGLTQFLPTPQNAVDASPSAVIFKVGRGAAGERVAYTRVFAGSLRVRDRVLSGGRLLGKVTGVETFRAGSSVRCDRLTAGQIGTLRGLDSVRIGDVLGAPRPTPGRATAFPPPALESVVTAARAAERARLHEALAELAEQDPLIGLRQDDERGETSVSLYGEVQKQVIQATLAADYGLAVRFRASTPICIERPIGSGSCVEQIGAESNPFLATVGLRVEPAPAGSGIAFCLGVERGSMPAAFFTAVEETVTATLHQGLRGWPVPDCSVTMTESGYWPRQSHAHGTFDASMSSTAGDFRHLTPLVLMTALRRAGTVVCEPIHRFDLELPAEVLGLVLSALARVRGVPQETDQRAGVARIHGDVPAARVHELQQQIPGLTRGEGLLVTEFDHYGPVAGQVPGRPRTDHNPLDRREYLLRIQRRVPAKGP